MAAVNEWEVGSLKLKPDVVWSMALSSLRLRIGRSLLTVLTIATSSAFMTYLLTMPRRGDDTERQSWMLMMVLALVVSTAGLLNTMLMSVTQRYREIGTMKCLGALDSFVLLSVLLEAVLLGAAGACIGIVGGFIVSGLLAFADFGAGFVGHLSLAWWAAKVALVFGTAMALTTAGASIPAWIASKMPPMDAMRGEK